MPKLRVLGKKKKDKKHTEEAVGEAAGPQQRSGLEEDTTLALSKLLDAEDDPGPWPPAMLQKGEDGYKFNTKWKQQRYKVSIVPYQFPKSMLIFGVLMGVLFLSFGSVMLEAAESLHVIRKVYDCNFPGSGEQCVCDGLLKCADRLEVPQDMGGGLVLFYELEGFKQNHRRYKPSFSLEQLQYGNDGTTEPETSELKACDPRPQTHRNLTDGLTSRNINRGDGVWTPLDYGYIGSGKDAAYFGYRGSEHVKTPCGLHTGWVYDDSVILFNSSGVSVGTPWKHDDWDVAPAKLINSTDARFISWMRSSPFAVRKPLLLIPGGLAAGTYDLQISNHYNAAVFRGRKTLVLAQFSSNGGGKHSKITLGVIAVVVGVLALAAMALVLGLSAWKGSPLRKRRREMLEALQVAERSERASRQPDLPWGDTGGSEAADPFDTDQAIRRGLDLIDKYAVAPTVEALEKLVAGGRPSGGSTLLDAARLMSVSEAGAPIGSSARSSTSSTGSVGMVDEAADALAQETGGRD